MELLTLAMSFVFASLSLIFLLILLYYCGAGIDSTDESYYLLFIENPRDYDFTVTQFGYLYGMIYSLLGRDIILLRCFSALTLSAASLLLFHLVLSRTFGMSRTNSIVVSAISSASIAYFYTLWIPTPGYNSLNMLGLLITASGMIAALPKAETANSPECGGGNRKGVTELRTEILNNAPSYRPLQNVCGWILIGIGGWLCFMAKPPTALALAALVLGFAFPARGYASRLILVSIATAFVLSVISAFYIDGSLSAFIFRYTETLKDMDTAGSVAEYGIFSNIRLDLVFMMGTPSSLSVAALLFFAGVSLLIASRSESPLPIAILLILSFLVFLTVLILDLEGGRLSLFQGWAPVPILGGAWLLTATKKEIHMSRSIRNRMSGQRTVSACLVFLPIIYGFGSNNPLPYSAPAASVFFICAFLLQIGRPCSIPDIRLAIGVSVICQLLALSGLAASWAVPYRQNVPLWEMNDPAPLRSGDSTLRLSASQARFLGELHTKAKIAGLMPGTPVIDMTGVYPLAVFAASGRSFVSPFIVAGYHWSNSAAATLIKRMPCWAAADSWIVVTDRPYFIPIDPTVLLKAGIDLDRNYRFSFSVKSFMVDRLGTLQDLYFLRPSDPQLSFQRCLSVKEGSSTDAP